MLLIGKTSENENPNKIVNIVKKVLDFNKQQKVQEINYHKINYF